jgi:hypothetical protein
MHQPCTNPAPTLHQPCTLGLWAGWWPMAARKRERFEGEKMSDERQEYHDASIEWAGRKGGLLSEFAAVLLDFHDCAGHDVPEVVVDLALAWADYTMGSYAEALRRLARVASCADDRGLCNPEALEHAARQDIESRVRLLHKQAQRKGNNEVNHENKGG